MTEFQGDQVVQVMVGKQNRAHVKRLCAVCGSEFLAAVAKLKIGKGAACSKRCRAQLGWGKRRTEGKSKPRKPMMLNGYRFVHCPSHPRAAKHRSRAGYVQEHVIVAERMLGRSLEPNEVVHHVNGLRADNRPENLAVMTSRDHGTLHAKRHRHTDVRIRLRAQIRRLEILLKELEAVCP